MAPKGYVFLKSSPNIFTDYEKGKRARRILTRCPLLGAVGWWKPQVNPVFRSQEQSSRDPPKEWPSFRHLSKWFTHPASWGLLVPLLFLAKAVTCWSRVGLLHSKAHLHIPGALLQATSICLGMPLRHWGRCLASSAAGSAMTNWSWLFRWGRSTSQGQLSFLYRNDSSTSYPHTQWGLFVSGVLDPDQVWSALG